MASNIVGTIPEEGSLLISQPVRNNFSLARSEISALQRNKQDRLISGDNIKTINGMSLLGSGDIVISADGGGAPGTVTNISTGAGLSGGPITTSGTISLNSPLTGWIFENSIFTGTVTLPNGSITSSALALGAVGVTSIATGTGLTGGPVTTAGTIALANTSVAAGTYQGLTIDAQGRVTEATDAGYLTLIALDPILIGKQDNLISGVNIRTINGQSLFAPMTDLVIAGGAGGTVTSVTVNAPLVGGTITSTGSIGLGFSGVIPGTYQGLTINEHGLVTQAIAIDIGDGGTTVTLPLSIVDGGTNAMTAAQALDNLSGATSGVGGALQRNGTTNQWSVQAVDAAGVNGGTFL